MTIYQPSDGSRTYPHGIKPYKIKRLFFHAGFRQIWNTADFQSKTYIQLLYKLINRMYLSRLTDSEVLQLAIGWHHKHDLRIDYEGLKFIIEAEKQYTLPLLREWKRGEMRRYRARKKTQAVAVDA